MFVPMQNSSSYINLTSVCMLSYHFTAVFITLGLTIKYLSPLQIAIMAILEMLFVVCCKHFMSFLTVEDSTGVLSIHIFGSLFGLGANYIFSFDSFFNIRRPDDFMTSDSRLYKSLTYWERMRLNQRQTFRNVCNAYYKPPKTDENIYSDKRTHESFDEFQRRSRKGSVLSSASNHSHEYEFVTLPEIIEANEEIGSSSNEVVNFDRKINNLWPDIESDVSNHSSGVSGGGGGGGVSVSDGNSPILMKYFDIIHYFSIAILFIYFPNFNSMGVQISSANMTSSLFPSFNVAFVKPFLCICSSVATSFSLSILTNQSSDLKKIALTDCRSAIIAAGVSIGAISRLSLHPAIYIFIGMISGSYTSIDMNFLKKIYIFCPVIDIFYVKNNNYSGHAAGGVIGIFTSIIASACCASKFLPQENPSVFNQDHIPKSNDENENQWAFQIVGLVVTATIAFLTGLITAQFCVFADKFVSRYVIKHKRSENSILQLHHNISFNSLEENNDSLKEAESPKRDGNDSPITPIADSPTSSSNRLTSQSFPFIDKYTVDLAHESSTCKKLSSSHENGLSLTPRNVGIMAKQASDGATQGKNEDDVKKMKKLSWPEWIIGKMQYVYSAPAIDTNPRFVSEDELELVKKLDNLLIEQTGVKNVLALKNHQFTLFFAQYIIEEWNLNYFAYDHLKDVYQELKDNKKNVSLQDYVSYQEAYENIFLKEIMRVDMFICRQLKEIAYDITLIRDYWIKLDVAAKVKVNADEQEKDRLEGEIRKIYETCTKLESFHKLNEFIIFKIVKKYEKLHEVSKKVKNVDFKEWKKHDSYCFFKDFFENRRFEINDRKKEVINVYSSILRQTYAKLAEGELRFAKDYEFREGFLSTLKTSIKLGLIVTSLFWISVDMRNKGGVSIWVRPELYVFSCVSSFLVFKTTWIFNTWIWSKFHINYTSLLQLTTLEKPNHLLLIDKASTLLVILLACMILFFKAINPEASFYNPELAYACPVFLILSLSINEIYDAFKYRNSVVSRGLFDFETLKLSFSTPFVAVRFRENYCCDVLTSFTKIIIDSSFAACWLISGYIFNPTHEKDAQTISDFGSSYLQCNTPTMASYTTFVVLFPLTLRALQCLRNCKDHGFHPHFWNFLKYASSMSVPIYGYYRSGMPDHIALIVLASLYKWWWDVVMDWGLFSILPTSYDNIFKRKPGEYLFLRKNLIYRNPLYYYIAIILDLLLRFLWVISLVPSLYGVFEIGPTLSLFMGSAELCRRAMWGVFRVEWEHLKFVDKHVIGYKLEKHIK